MAKAAQSKKKTATRKKKTKAKASDAAAAKKKKTGARAKSEPGAQNGTGTRKKRAKRGAAPEAVLPKSTSRRMAEAARASVWAISSEKTTDQFQAAEDLAREEEAQRTDALIVPQEVETPESALRRCSRDPFGFFREELMRDEADDDPHAVWRADHGRQRHELLPGSTPSELAELERTLRIQLPPSYYDFSLEWSGGMVYVREMGLTRIVRAVDLLEEVRGPLYGRMARPFLPLVDLGCGDYLALDTSRGSKNGEFPLFWWFEGQPRRKVADSFAQWLRKLVEHGGDPFWWR